MQTQSPDVPPNATVAPTEEHAARAKVLNRRARLIFWAAIPLAVIGGFFRSMSHAFSIGLYMWGYSLGMAAVFSLLGATFVGYFSKNRTPLLRPRVHLWAAMLLVVLLAYFSIMGINT